MLGTHLTLLIGRGVPLPIPPSLLYLVDRVEVVDTAEGFSGFEVAFFATRSGAAAFLGPTVPSSGLLDAFNRVRIIVTVNGSPSTLIDGVITHVGTTPGPSGLGGRVVIKGEDLSALMDLEERQATFPALADWAIASKVIAGYSTYGVVPRVIPAASDAQPSPLDSPPTQDGETDRELLLRLAAKYGYQFHVSPDPYSPGSVAYWGPQRRLGVPHRALTVGSGPQSNVSDAEFRFDALAAEKAEASVLAPGSGRVTTVSASRSTLPPLARTSGLRSAKTRKTIVRSTSGLTASQARGEAQGLVNASTNKVAVGTGVVDTSRYGGILKAHSPVGVRGVGPIFDGNYVLQTVRHTIRKGEYKQHFEVVRDGTGALAPLVRP